MYKADLLVHVENNLLQLYLWCLCKINLFFTFEIIAAPTTLISFFMFEFLESAKSEVVKWCLNNSFEFIEMNSEEEETEEEEGNVNVSFP